MLTLNTLDESRQGLEYSDFDMVALTKTVCATFGAVGQTSAPGQMNAEDLDTVLELIHRSL